ncbi:putative peptidoglycan binding protein [Branchiibius hedensis]|uniref:Peptidoglycan binding domain-containing protein n=1 Tax=Branchiibius hedensis TaxID=672460 RepID=A0A2Y8ZTN8_9MICO|nr:peptidoglycan-binding protein [Branchiibius hedensis]PWJ26960.1 putative peptidoglycan binding protein [Branchiibius hedensis]SSA35771.1 Putative peptidoglycan binding domain-containing protein [Branchiibius hedensis]
MTTTAPTIPDVRLSEANKPRHQRQRPGLSAKVAPMVTSRKGLVLSGTALAVPASAGAVLAATPAEAAVSPVSAVRTPSVVHVTTTPTSSVVVVSYNDTGALVKTIQQRLGGLELDGWFGPKTLAAVKAFQTSKGLVADGVVGALTWRALGGFPGGSTGTGGSTGGGSGSGGTSCTVKVLRYGASGDAVQVLQQRLGKGLADDGEFGALTLAALKSYQAAKGLVVDGIAGPATWSALGGFPCGTTATGGTGTGTGTGTGGGTTTPVQGPLQQKAIAIAKQYLGIPYVLGGNTPAQGFDCSGLTKYVYAQLGVTLPRTARAQQAFLGNTSNPVPGDLVFFGNPAYHVGIYLGNNTMLAAPHPGEVVRIQPIYTTPSSYGHVTGN